MYKQFIVLSLAVVIAGVCFSRAAFSEPCSDGPEPVIPIQTQADGCWNYTGNAIYFSGLFSRGRTIEVHMSGEAAEQGNDNKIVTYSANRDANVEGPNEFYIESTSNDGSLTFRVPKDGTYKFSYGPRAMLCANGQVKICVK